MVFSSKSAASAASLATKNREQNRWRLAAQSLSARGCSEAAGSLLGVCLTAGLPGHLRGLQSFLCLDSWTGWTAGAVAGQLDSSHGWTAAWLLGWSWPGAGLIFFRKKLVVAEAALAADLIMFYVIRGGCASSGPDHSLNSSNKC